MNQQKRLYGLGINALNPSDFLMMNLSPRNMWGQSINFNMVSSRPHGIISVHPLSRRRHQNFIIGYRGICVSMHFIPN